MRAVNVRATYAHLAVRMQGQWTIVVNTASRPRIGNWDCRARVRTDATGSCTVTGPKPTQNPFPPEYGNGRDFENMPCSRLRLFVCDSCRMLQELPLRLLAFREIGETERCLPERTRLPLRYRDPRTVRGHGPDRNFGCGWEILWKLLDPPALQRFELVG